MIKCEKCQKERYPNQLKPIVEQGWEWLVCQDCATTHGEERQKLRDKAREYALRQGEGMGWVK
jgi:protein-arginine kinase activator protein McsA